MNIIRLSDLKDSDVRAIWNRVFKPATPMSGAVAWSFEGNGIRTRTTFIQAFRELGLTYTELPDLLKTAERPKDIAGYLDAFYDMYVIRESNHMRLAEFAAASRRPVINAMSAEGHPCEVLTDAYYVDTSVAPLSNARVCLWGPTTNVFRSWHELASVLGFSLMHVCEVEYHEVRPNVQFVTSPPASADVVITDGWPTGVDAISLTEAHLAGMGNPRLLPTPPFSIGREVAFDPLGYVGFSGYSQKELLLPVQIAIVRHAAES